MTIRFGVSPIAWINDDMPELGADTPLETVLRDAHEIGFTGVELGGRFPHDAAALKALLDRHGLDLVGGWYSANLLTRGVEEELAALKPHLRLLQAMGSDVFIAAETSNAVHGRRETALSDTPRLDGEAWKRFGERLTGLAEAISREGLRFAYHHHLGTVVERPEDLEAFVASTGEAVGLTVDTGHAALGGVDPVALMRDHPRRVAHVHCKDVRRPVFAEIGRSQMSFLNGVLAGMFTVPGDGEIAYDEVMRTLADIGYSGWVVVEAEQDPAVAPPRPYAEQGLATLRAAAANAGLTVDERA